MDIELIAKEPFIGMAVGLKLEHRYLQDFFIEAKIDFKFNEENPIKILFKAFWFNFD